MQDLLLIFNPKRVATGLRAGSITEYAKARLIVTGYLVGLIFGAHSLPGFRTAGDMFLSVVLLGIVFGGFWSCFRANENGDGRCFIERFFCISVPVQILVSVGYFAVYYITFLAMRSRPGYDAASFASTVRPYFTLLAIAVTALVFAIDRRLIGQVSAVSGDHHAAGEAESHA